MLYVLGSYEFKFTKGIEEFIEITKIVYGRFCASAWKDETTFLYTRQRAAYIWKLVEGEFRLLHLHCTMARDVPLEGDVNISTKQKADIHWYDYMLHAEKLFSKEPKHFLLKDGKGGLHYLLPTEILYISISYRIAAVCTLTGSFRVHKSLSQLLELMPFLIQSHKSWLVNPLYITEIFLFLPRPAPCALHCFFPAL